MKLLRDIVAAFQFLTRIPIPNQPFDDDSVSRASKFFPLVGLVVGLLAAFAHSIVLRYSNPQIASVSTLCFLVLITGAFHEDALADAADGFGGGWTRERVLEIMRDSRVGSYGAVAVCISLLTRFVLLQSLPPSRVLTYLVSAHMLCRWSTLPLGSMLPPARLNQGAGATVAQRVSRTSLVVGTLFSLGSSFLFLRIYAAVPIIVAMIVTWLSALYYKKRIGGVTGDCFGATNQVVEIAVYACGVFHQ